MARKSKKVSNGPWVWYPEIWVLELPRLVQYVGYVFCLEQGPHYAWGQTKRSLLAAHVLLVSGGYLQKLFAVAEIIFLYLALQGSEESTSEEAETSAMRIVGCKTRCASLNTPRAVTWMIREVSRERSSHKLNIASISTCFDVHISYLYGDKQMYTHSTSASPSCLWIWMTWWWKKSPASDETCFNHLLHQDYAVTSCVSAITWWKCTSMFMSEQWTTMQFNRPTWSPGAWGRKELFVPVSLTMSTADT